MIPWRLKNAMSEHFPLLYHLVVNAKLQTNSSNFWDEELERTWDSLDRDWPTKNALVETLTSESDNILDVGCGTGSMLRHLQSAGYNNLNGLEFSKLAVEKLSAIGISMHHAKLPNLPLEDNSYDVVIASQVLEHIIRRKTFMGGMRRILKPGGKVFIFVPDNCLGPIDEPSHVMKFTADMLRELMAPYFHELKIESIKDKNFEIPILFGSATK